ncbi:MAG: DUF3516 domain-containing protein [Alphaproteobacteria bacterium]|nr:DUF3516 domain-containing protein [Alphaproteobacteria bacterium]
MTTLAELVPPPGSPPDAVLDAFLEWVAALGLELYPAQEEAILELFADRHVVLDTPTGSGKSMVALALAFREFSLGRRCIYTAPIKALVSEKYRELAAQLGHENVGMMTGDGSVNRDAPVLCCTAEVLAKIALRYGADLPLAAVVMDEFHFYGDRDRGMAWQVPLLMLPHVRFLLMSATLGDTRVIREDLHRRTGIEPAVVKSPNRPVPLTFTYRETPLEGTLRDLVAGNKAPIYTVHFTQRAAAEHAQALLSTSFASTEEKERIKAAVGKFRFDSPYGKTMRRLVLHGIGLHHAGLLPKYRMLVEKLAQQGLFHIICGTDTLGVGINVPIRTVLFTQLCKFDGQDVSLLSSRHFKQIAGRAGRKGYDDHGFVVAQAPEWIIENKKLSALVETGAKKKSKVVMKKPPTRGYKHWDEATFEQLVASPPEELKSRFTVDHGLVLLMLQRAGDLLTDGMEDVRGLIDASHASAREKPALHEQADQRLDQLVHAGVVEDLGADSLPRYRVQPDLQDDFSLHHSLSLYLLHAIGQLDPASPTYAVDVLTQVESILENPAPVLAAQVSREKTALLADLKARGMEYEERMEALEGVTHPKPMAEWIYATYNAYKEHHPWLESAPIRPKGVVREMYETQAVFSTYVKSLGFERAEGVLLRYCSQVYRTLLQNVPEAARTPELLDVAGYLRALLARVDDSLVSAWEVLTAGGEEDDAAERPLWTDPRALRARIRAELHALVHALAEGDWEEAAALVRDDSEWDAAAFEAAIAPYVEERGPVRFDARVRQGWTTVFEAETAQRWTVRQILVDDDEEDDAWSIDGVVDLSGDADPSGPLVRILAIGA